MSALSYSVFFIGDDGLSRHTETIEAVNDDEAIELAQDKLDTQGILPIADIWRDSERVAIIARQAPLSTHGVAAE